MIFKKQFNTCKILFYTLIYKYLFTYIFFILFLFYMHKYCCLVTFSESKNIFHFLIFWVSFYMFFISFIITFINFILILLNIYIEKQNYKNKEEVKYFNEIKKINNIEIKLISLSFISFLLVYFTPILKFLNLGFYMDILIILFLGGIFPISILEILYYYEKKINQLKVGPT